MNFSPVSKMAVNPDQLIFNDFFRCPGYKLDLARRNQFIQLARIFILLIWDDMRVGIQGQGVQEMAQSQLSDLRRGDFRQNKGGGGVAQIILYCKTITNPTSGCNGLRSLAY